MHLLRQVGLLAVLAQGSQAVALAAPAPSEDPAALDLLLNNTNLELAKRQGDIRNAGTLFVFVGGGCNTAGGIRSYTLWLESGCQAVTNVGSAAWTEKTPGYRCGVKTWSGSNCQGSQARLERQQCTTVQFGSFSWVCDCDNQTCPPE